MVKKTHDCFDGRNVYTHVNTNGLKHCIVINKPLDILYMYVTTITLKKEISIVQ